MAKKAPPGKRRGFFPLQEYASHEWYDYRTLRFTIRKGERWQCRQSAGTFPSNAGDGFYLGLQSRRFRSCTSGTHPTSEHAGLIPLLHPQMAVEHEAVKGTLPDLK